MATSYTSDKKIGALDPITGTLSVNDEIVVNKNGDTLKASMTDVEKFVFSTKTPVSPQNGDVVVVRRGTDIRQVTTENLLPNQAVADAQISNTAAIAHSKLASMPSANILLGNASNVPTSTAVTGDVTIGNTGVTAIAAGAIVDADVNALAAISLSKLATGALPTGITVASANLVNGTIVNDDIATNAAILGTKIAPDFGSQNVVTTGTIQRNGAQSDYTSLVLNNTSGVQVHLNANANSEGNLRTVTNHPLSFSTNNTERMRIDVNGNLGIGTSSPVAYANNTTLTLVGTNGSGLSFGQNVGTSRSELYHSSTETYLKTVSNTSLWIGTNNVERMRITNSGLVGIATATPFTRLDVVGPNAVTAFTGSTRLGVTVRGSTAANDYSGIDFSGSNQTLPTARIAVLSGASGSSLMFGTSNNYGTGITNTALAINPAGNLGIGTTSPSYRIDVVAADGNGYAQRIRSHDIFGEARLQFTNNAGTIQNGYIAGNDTGRSVSIVSGDQNNYLEVSSVSTVNSRDLDVYGDVYADSNINVKLQLQADTVNLLNRLNYAGTQVVSFRRTGWGAPTGTATRTAFATGSVTLVQLAERVKALIDDLRAHGLIGN